jgi:hypothetical protein
MRVLLNLPIDFFLLPRLQVKAVLIEGSGSEGPDFRKSPIDGSEIICLTLLEKIADLFHAFLLSGS